VATLTGPPQHLGNRRPCGVLEIRRRTTVPGRGAESISSLSPAALRRTPPGKKVSNFAVLSGIAAHDLYHAGQIQLLKRLMR
jgi:hypothetical protein